MHLFFVCFYEKTLFVNLTSKKPKIRIMVSYMNTTYATVYLQLCRIASKVWISLMILKNTER